MTEEIKTTENNEKIKGSYEVGYCKPPKEHWVKEGEIKNPGGRGKGALNRSTMAKFFLDMSVVPSGEILRGLQGMFPNYFDNKSKEWTAEYIIWARQLQKAILRGDQSAFENLIDAKYGKLVIPMDTNINVVGAKELADKLQDILEDDISSDTKTKEGN